MLSYMVPSPIEDKPPVAPVVSNKNTLRLVLENHVNRNGNITMASIPNGNVINTHKKIIKNSSMTSAESSNSSLNSSTDIPSVHGSTPSVEKPKPKMTNGSVKQATLKRVSFGSSKGSMVETLIYETPVQEEPEPTPSQKSTSDKSDDTDSYSTCEGVKVPSSKVRVSFFESTEKKYVLSAPDNLTNSEDLVIYEQLIMSSPSQMNNTTVHSYGRQESTDSGWDNPFRPDGDLSKEADEIVELIKEGKPITPTQNNPSSKLLHDDHDGNATITDKQNLASSPKGSKINGSAKLENSVVSSVEVQHVTTATPTDGTQVEHVVIKKKPKKCCVVQ